jgi:hypothetical protein
MPHNAVQGKHKATKFTCKQRAALLTVLYQSIAAAGGGCPISRKVLGCAGGHVLSIKGHSCFCEHNCQCITCISSAA